VTIVYWAKSGLDDELMAALRRTRNLRRRTGATSWRAWRDVTDPGRLLEQFVVGSWDEHLRQHERVTKRDQANLDRVRELTDPARPVSITHWVALSPTRSPRHPEP
jgi:hypothetical protein